MKLCSEPDCGKQLVAKGLCSTHYRRVWVSNNRERNNANQRKYLKNWRQDKENPANLKARWERYRQNNLALFADKERRRRAKKRANGGCFSQRDWVRLLNRFDGRCAYCKTSLATTADHVIPVNKGGTGFIGNILPACFSCNSSKQDSLLFKWKIKNDRKNDNYAHAFFAAPNWQITEADKSTNR